MTRSATTRLQDQSERDQPGRARVAPDDDVAVGQCDTWVPDSGDRLCPGGLERGNIVSEPIHRSISVTKLGTDDRHGGLSPAWRRDSGRIGPGGLLILCRVQDLDRSVAEVDDEPLGARRPIQDRDPLIERRESPPAAAAEALDRRGRQHPLHGAGAGAGARGFVPFGGLEADGQPPAQRIRDRRPPAHGDTIAITALHPSDRPFAGTDRIGHRPARSTRPQAGAPHLFADHGRERPPTPSHGAIMTDAAYVPVARSSILSGSVGYPPVSGTGLHARGGMAPLARSGRGRRRCGPPVSGTGLHARGGMAPHARSGRGR